jgi:hypothetical protein
MRGVILSHPQYTFMATLPLYLPSLLPSNTYKLRHSYNLSGYIKFTNLSIFLFLKLWTGPYVTGNDLINVHHFFVGR